MKRMKKRLLVLGLAALTVLASSVTGFAEDRQGASGWQVVFDGKKLESNFSTANMDDEIYNMQPGDSVELTITLKNEYDKGQAVWYMKNQVLQTLEDSGNISGGAYDYLLTYTDADGQTTTLYSSEKFGGEGRYNGVGLKGATTTLDDYFYLDRMGKDDSGVVKLKVALDAETLVNDYQNTLARLQMDFATELVDAAAGGGDGSGDGSGGNGTTTPGSGRSPVKTGDQTKIMLYIVLTLAAGLVLLFMGIMRLRRDREEEPVTAEGPKGVGYEGSGRSDGKGRLDAAGRKGKLEAVGGPESEGYGNSGRAGGKGRLEAAVRSKSEGHGSSDWAGGKDGKSSDSKKTGRRR